MKKPKDYETASFKDKMEVLHQPMRMAGDDGVRIYYKINQKKKTIIVFHVEVEDEKTK